MNSARTRNCRGTPRPHGRPVCWRSLDTIGLDSKVYRGCTSPFVGTTAHTHHYAGGSAAHARTHTSLAIRSPRRHEQQTPRETRTRSSSARQVAPFLLLPKPATWSPLFSPNAPDLSSPRTPTPPHQRRPDLACDAPEHEPTLAHAIALHHELKLPLP